MKKLEKSGREKKMFKEVARIENKNQLAMAFLKMIEIMRDKKDGQDNF